MVDRQTFGDAMTDVGARNVVEGRVEKGYIGGQFVSVYVEAAAWKYRDVVVGEYVFVVIPLGKRHPIVGSDKENERALRLVVGQSLQRSPGVRRRWQVQFVVGGAETRLVGRGSAHYFEPRFVGHQVVGVAFKGVLRRHDKPHFV